MSNNFNNNNNIIIKKWIKNRKVNRTIMKIIIIIIIVLRKLLGKDWHEIGIEFYLMFRLMIKENKEEMGLELRGVGLKIDYRYTWVFYQFLYLLIFS